MPIRANMGKTFLGEQLDEMRERARVKPRTSQPPMTPKTRQQKRTAKPRNMGR